MPAPVVSPIDVRLSVVAHLLRPALTLARLMGLSLDDLREMVETSYVKELQDRGLSWEGIARRLGKSRRTIATLVRRVSTHRPPLADSQRLGAQRWMIERLSHGPVPREELLPGWTDADGEEVLEQLIGDGLVHVDEEGIASVRAGLLDLVSSDVEARFDSLRHFLDVVTTAVHQRFFPSGEDEDAFVRTLTFQVSEDRLRALRDQVYAMLEAQVFAADADAEGSDAPSASVAFVVTRPSSDARLRP